MRSLCVAARGIEYAVVADLHHTLAKLASVGFREIGEEDESYM
jgi:hypothetical protein